MTNLQSQSCEILFDLVTGLEPRLKPLHDWYFQLCSTIDKWKHSEGNQGIKRAKDCLTQGWLSILDEETTQLDFVKTVDKVPALVQPLVSRVKRLHYDARLLSAVLSFVRLPDLWLGSIQDSTVLDQVRVIQDSKLPLTAKEVIREFSEDFLPSFLERYPQHPAVRAYLKSFHLGDANTAIYRESKGPNGRLTASAHKDVLTLNESMCSDGNSLLSHTQDLGQLICDNADFSFGYPTRFSESVLSWGATTNVTHSEYPGKLTCIPEKAGKVRIVASPDYFTQLTLKPVSDWLFNILKNIDADCTFDQRSAIPKIQRWQASNNAVYSFDQSSCTDLFPFEFQLTILNHRFGEAVTESVKTVMSDREWELKLPSGLSKSVRWSVGQPMGVYASWPLMAVAHHLLVQYSVWRSQGRKFSKASKPFNKYVICGDDIVIGDQSVAESYAKIVRLLGMRVNRNKSHISGGQTGILPVSEFAKITVWKGQPLFPIRPNMILAGCKDWRKVVPLLIDTVNSGFKPKLRFLERLIKKHFATRQKFLIPLLTIPSELGGVGYRDNVSLKGKFDLLKTGEIHPWLLYLALRIKSGLIKEHKALVCEELSDLPSRVFYEHPLTTYRNRIVMEGSYLEHLVRSEEIPQVHEIVKSLMLDGIQGYDRFLVKSNTKEWVPPTWESSDKSLLYQRTLWERALRKGPVQLKNYKQMRSLMPSFYFDSVSSADPREARKKLDESFRLCQQDIVEHVMLAVRSN